MPTHLGIDVDAGRIYASLFGNETLNLLQLDPTSRALPCFVQWDGQAGQAVVGDQARQAYEAGDSQASGWFIDDLGEDTHATDGVSPHILAGKLAEGLVSRLRAAIESDDAMKRAQVVLTPPAGWSAGDPASRALALALQNAGLGIRERVPATVAVAAYQAHENQLQGKVLVCVVGSSQTEAAVIEVVPGTCIRQIASDRSDCGTRMADACLALACVRAHPSALGEFVALQGRELLGRTDARARSLLADAADWRQALCSSQDQAVTLGSATGAGFVAKQSLCDEPQATALSFQQLIDGLEPWAAEVSEGVARAVQQAGNMQPDRVVVAGDLAALQLTRDTVAVAAGLPRLGLKDSAEIQDLAARQGVYGAALIAASKVPWRPPLRYDISVEAVDSQGRQQSYAIARAGDLLPLMEPVYATRDRGAPFFLTQEPSTEVLTRLMFADARGAALPKLTKDVRFHIPPGVPGRRLDFWLTVSEDGRLELGIEISAAGSAVRQSIFTGSLPA